MRTATYRTRCMGSALRLVVTGASTRDARAARDAAWREMRRTDRELSRFRRRSALSRANSHAGAGEVIVPGRRLRTLLTMSARAQWVTNGRFDARVITALEAIGEEAGVPMPTPASAGTRWLTGAGRRGGYHLAAPIDSGGLGKGLGLRWSLAAARRAAPRAAGMLLEAGGDVVALGANPEGDAWSVGIEDPTERSRLLATVRLREGALATSSVSVRSWIHEGRTVHHLIDPASGMPADGDLLAVTVHAADPAWAEVITKELFIGGRGSIGDAARARGLAAWWVEESGELHMSPAARAMTSWNLLDALNA